MSNWKPTCVSDLASTYAGGTPNRNVPEYFGGDIPWIKSTEVNHGTIRIAQETLTEKGLQCSSAKWIPSQSVLMAMYGATAGQIAFLEIEATANQAVLALVPNKNQDPRFLFYALSHAKEKILYLSQGSGQPNLSKNIIDRVSLDIPPLAEQQKIAQILCAVDYQIDQTHSLIAKYNAIKQGMMQDLFTRGVDSCGKLRPPYVEAPNLYKESELGKVPRNWRVSNVGEFLQRIEQGWSPDCSNDRAEHNQWGVLKTTAVVWDGYNYLENKVLPNQLHPRPEYEVKVGDILMTRGGPNSRVGVVAYVYNTKQKLMLSDKIYRLVPKLSINPEFLYLALASSHTQMYLSTMKTGLAESQTNISQKIVRRLLIPIPIPVEQQRVVSYSYRLNQLLFQEMQYLEKLKILKSGFMQDLLTGKVRVKVDESTGSKQDVGVLQS